MNAVPNWSSNYWAHHRNSMLLSGALLVISLPHSTATSGELVGLKLGAASLPIALLALASAATYAMINFYFEWREEVLPTFRTRTAQLLAFGKAVHEAVESEKEQVANLVSELRVVAFEDRRVISFRDIGKFSDSAEIIKEIIRNDPRTNAVFSGIEKRTIEVALSNAMFSDADAERARIRKMLIPEMARFRIDSVDEISGIVIDNYVKAVEDKANVAAARQDSLSGLVDELAKRFDLAYRSRSGASSVRVENAHEWSRSILLGILLPASLYAIAFSHFVGRIGLDFFESPLVWAVNSIRITP